MVGGERRGLHTPADGARCGRRVCPAPCPHLALRWRASQWKGTGYDRRFRDWTGRYPAGRSHKAVLAAGLGAHVHRSNFKRPSGTALLGGVFPGSSCQATIAPSLRDNSQQALARCCDAVAKCLASASRRDDTDRLSSSTPPTGYKSVNPRKWPRRCCHKGEPCFWFNHYCAVMLLSHLSLN